ncbi:MULTISPECIES: zinc-dependent alcohol dehydrogenase family protein [Thermus]|jgi:NADPH2:quinone reductase|uniref:NADPH-quinone reductase n=1 Tax=Thermus thermophilus (strain ATCC 27634 / DSM 579 / HB8) TaxID=300852 RepID=Q5SI53_THET8|nr:MULTISPECIES: zinc-dependent alcohol dehydrogenase family protein [Thermus]QZY58113.1 zinc-dependent alcohol dehydrogenase family protein [Thermus thermophilus]BAD71350.1 NADPH-quinone reductase [Thermus thermophilus HB8]BDA38143.1 NADPH:quinone oxidoreductase [Thermus thermophilus]BDE45868.1 NADPH:quinone oxidoreductase [Thermus thermophilus]HAH40454.1 NADPH:quinone oxidoreductase [Thermus sp.]
MRAVVLKGFGGLEMLEERDLPVPEPGPGEVLVRNLAVAVNPVDAKIRAAGRWAGVEPPFVLGYDAAGVVAKVGPGVKDLKEGDEVYYTPEIFGNPHGTYAEYTPVPAGIVAKKPKNLSFAEAAAIPLAGGTAWEAVVRRLAVRPGETVLVMGGAGGVGSFAVQFAKAAGAYVIATASAENLPVLKELGADLALDYRGPWAEEVLKATEGQGVDAAFETAGESLVERVIPVVRPFGRIATILPPQGNLSGLYTKNQTLYGVFLTRERKRLLEMRPLFERGLARPLIAEVLPFSLENLRKAHARMDSGHGRGKIVLTFQA